MPWRGCGRAEGGDGEGALAGSEGLGRGSDQRRVAVRVAAAVVSARRMACHVMLCAYLSRSLGAKRPSSVNGGESTEPAGVSLLVMLLERKLDCEKRAAIGESAGRGLRRTGDCTGTAIGTGCDDVWERKVAKD
jgi:hypothetical protein